MLILNVQDVVTRVKRTFGDDAGVQISDDDVIRWINDAQIQVSLDNEGLLETTVATDSISGQSQYSVPENMSVLRSLSYKNYRLKGMYFAEFNEYLDGFQDPGTYGSGVPEVFMVWENMITLFPTPKEGVMNALKIFYVKQPDPVSSLADNLGLPLQYHMAVVDYCLQQAYELDEDLEKSAYKKGQFDETVRKLNDRNKWTNQEYYPRITTLPEDENFGDFGYWGGFY